MSSPKTPSPDTQTMLKSSHLQGMERPVRSFKSFIRAIPPRTSPDKPLPPIPTEPQSRKISSSSSLSTVPTRNSRLSLWEAPSNWDNNDSCPDQSTPPFAIRQYSPLIPEPPEDIAAMQADPILWQQGHGPFQQTPLDPIHERNGVTPEVPPRNPSRLSLSLSNPATIRKHSKDTLPSASSRYSTGTFDDGLLAGSNEPALVEPAKEDIPSPIDLVSALTDMRMKEAGIRSSGLESRRDQGDMWTYQPQRSDSAQLDADVRLYMQDHKVKTFRKGNFNSQDNSEALDDLEVSDKMQALMFAQDYHNALADTGPTEHNQGAHVASAITPLQDKDLTPQPLTWKKASDGPPPSDTSKRPQPSSTSSSGRHRNLRMMSSWINHHLKRDQQTEFNRRSVSDPGSVPQMQIPESEVDQHLKSEARIANMVQHSKEFVARKILRRETEPTRPLLISLPMPQTSTQTTAIPAMATTPFEVAEPVLRLPGGLTLVRQSPVSTPRPQTADDSPSSRISDISWPDFPAPFLRGSSRRGSAQSTESQLQVESPPSVIQSQATSLPASPLRLQSLSCSTTSLPSSLPQDLPSPLSAIYSPPYTRRRSHNIGSPLSAHPSSYGETPDSLENVMHKLNLLEKAKHAHHVWKKHQKEVKNEKLKQSIRLIGPADATDVAGYIKCAADGRVSGDSGVGEGRLTGHTVKATF